MSILNDYFENKSVQHDELGKSVVKKDSGYSFKASESEIKEHLNRITDIGKELYTKLKTESERINLAEATVISFTVEAENAELSYDVSVSVSVNKDVIINTCLEKACSFGLISGMAKARQEDLESQQGDKQ